MTSLRSLGLSEYEERIYTSLHKIGRSDARQISKDSKVPPTAVYPNLKSLAAKGFIHRMEGDPATFLAIEPDLALKAWVDKKKGDMERRMKEAVKELKAIPPPLFKKRDPVSVSLGKEMSEGLFMEFAKSTQDYIYIMGWKFKSGWSPVGAIRKIETLVKAKREVRLITNDDEFKSNATLAAIARAGAKIRHFPTSNFSIVIKDGEEAKITLKNKDLEHRINIHIKDKDLSAAMKDYFLSVWEKAHPVSTP